MKTTAARPIEDCLLDLFRHRIRRPLPPATYRQADVRTYRLTAGSDGPRRLSDNTGR